MINKTETRFIWFGRIIRKKENRLVKTTRDMKLGEKEAGQDKKHTHTHTQLLQKCWRENVFRRKKRQKDKNVDELSLNLHER